MSILMSAAEARNLRPNDNYGLIIAAIDSAVRARSQAGIRTTDISGILPNWQQWLGGQANPTLDRVKAALEEGGYKIETYAGAPNARPYFRISWAD